MTRHSAVGYSVFTATLVALLACVVIYELSPWWRVLAVIVSILAPAKLLHYQSRAALLVIVVLLTAVIPIGMLYAMSLHFDGRARFLDFMGLTEWIQLVAPTLAAIVILSAFRRWFLRH